MSKSDKMFPCSQCGAELEFHPGVAALKCPYCAGETPIPQSDEAVEELDFHAAVQELTSDDAMVEEAVVKCPGCGAQTTLEPNVTADRCVFCGTAVVAEMSKARVIKPRSLLPFKVEQKEALKLFRKWVNSLWFAPNALKNYAGMESRLNGMYVPYWTYDAATITLYRGERGDNYTETEHYTVQEDGKTVHKTRQVTKTRWTSVSGTVWDCFDDVLVLASESLPRKVTEALEPWDLQNLVPFTEDYLSGFRAEAYQVDLESGFGRAKEVMEGEIRTHVRRDIGGDKQRVHSMRTQYNNVSFKHILLPIWISTYRYQDKAYRFVVNGRTGEVQGERPWSWVKIGLAVLAGLAVAGTLAILLSS